MQGKYRVVALGFILVLGLTGCGQDDSTLPGAPVAAGEPGAKPALVAADPTYELVLGEGITQEMAGGLLSHLPTRILETAEFIYLGPSSFDAAEGYCALAGWQVGARFHTELWNLSLAKEAGSPLYTFQVSDGETGDVFQGTNDKFMDFAQGKPVLHAAQDKLTMEQFCDALGFVVDIICPIVSLIPPWGGVVCAFLATVNSVVC